MSDVLNLNAESGRNIIGDDSGPTLTLENTSSGESLKLQNAGGTGVQLGTVSCPTTSIFAVGAKNAADFRSGASASTAVVFSKTVISSPTVALVKFSTSGASAPALEFAGQCIQSTASATASLIGGIRVKFGDVYGWIPVAVNIA